MMCWDSEKKLMESRLMWLFNGKIYYLFIILYLPLLTLFIVKDGWNYSSTQFYAAPYCHAVVYFSPTYCCAIWICLELLDLRFFFSLLQVLRCLFRHNARLCKQHTDDWWWHSHRWCESRPNKNSQQFGEEVKVNQGLLNIGSLVLFFLFAPTKIFGCFCNSLAFPVLLIQHWIYWTSSGFSLALLSFWSFCSDVHATPVIPLLVSFEKKQSTPWSFSALKVLTLSPVTSLYSHCLMFARVEGLF